MPTCAVCRRNIKKENSPTFDKQIIKQILNKSSTNINHDTAIIASKIMGGKRPLFYEVLKYITDGTNSKKKNNTRYIKIRKQRERIYKKNSKRIIKLNKYTIDSSLKYEYKIKNKIMKVLVIGRYLKTPIYNIDEYDYICYVNCENKHDNLPKYKCICEKGLGYPRCVKRKHQECIIFDVHQTKFKLRKGDKIIPTQHLEYIRTVCPGFKKRKYVDGQQQD